MLSVSHFRQVYYNNLLTFFIRRLGEIIAVSHESETPYIRVSFTQLAPATSLTFSLKLINLCSDEYLTMNPTSFTSSYVRKLTCTYNLHLRQHNRQLTRKSTHINDSLFFIRILYKDSY